MSIKAIVATGYDGAIGCRGAIPWIGDVPRDMKYFMDATRNSIIIMGRVTADSLKLPLKTRTGIIITTRVNETLERYGQHSHVVDSFDAALEKSKALLTDGTVKPESDVFIIGGAQVYTMAMQRGLIDTMYLTTIHGNFKADAFFHFDRTGYDLISTEHHAPDEKNKYGCTFEVFSKLRNT